MRYQRILTILLSITVMMIAIFPGGAYAQDDASPVIQFGGGRNFDLDSSLDLFVAERLREKGFEVEVTIFADSNFTVEAMTRNDIHFTSGSVRNDWRAMLAGAEMVTIAETVGMDFVMLGSTNIQNCEDWEGRTIAYDEISSLSAALGDFYFTNNCTDSAPEVVYIDGSSSRTAALLSGAIDATIVHLDSGLTLLNDSPEDFYLVADLSSELSFLLGTGLTVSTAFAEEHPETVAEVLKTYLQVIREINDAPGDYIEFTAEGFKEPAEEVTVLVEAYINAGLYDVNGGLSEERTTQTIEFLVAGGFLPDELTAADVTDLTYLEAALEKLDSE